MVATGFQRRFTAAIAVVGAFFSMGAAPAFAASASADIAAPIREARSQSINSSDDQFKQLFSGWQSLDSGAPVTTAREPAMTMSVAIPSRAPLAIGSTSSGYGLRNHPVLGGMRAHKGIDLAAPVGTPIYATADGVVGKAEWFSSYGMFVAIEHGGDLETRYAHMSRIAVAAGEHVRKGEIIGYVGTTGRSTGPHLHYEVRVSGEAVNPMPYMADAGASAATVLAAR